MIKSAMRQALKESLLSRKQGSRHDRARYYTENRDDGAEDEYQGKLIVGAEQGLRDKVEDAEEDGMTELQQEHPSEYEGSPEEEMSESDDEAKEEGDPPEYRDEDYWREEQKDFMKGKSTAKKPKKSASFFEGKGKVGKMLVKGGKGLTNKKIDPPFQPRSSKGNAQQTIG